MKTPTVWTREQLVSGAAEASAAFREARLAETAEEWERHYTEARTKFSALFERLGNLTSAAVNEANMGEAYKQKLGEAFRYLAGPPISDDDLRVIADVPSIVPGVLGVNVESRARVFAVIERIIDRHRFPWLMDGTNPTPQQLEAALLASSVLLAAQRISTKRRNDGKATQEALVKQYLRTLRFTEVPPRRIDTIVGGPQAMQFCGECQLGDRKADIVVRLHDTRLMAIECKVSNSATNSVKRLNNDAAVNAEYWLNQFGIRQVVPAAALAGVFNVLNLVQAQARGLAMFWTHDLDRLGEFIELAQPEPPTARERRRSYGPSA